MIKGHFKNPYQLTIHPASCEAFGAINIVVFFSHLLTILNNFLTNGRMVSLGGSCK